MLLLAGWEVYPAKAGDVVLVKSKEMDIYDKAIVGFRETFAAGGDILVMQGPLAEPANLVSAVREKRPKVIIAIGLQAAMTLRAQIADIPIVFCLAINPIQNKLVAGNVTGVDLESPIHEQLAMFKEVIPNLKRLGVVYDPKHSKTFVEQARAAADKIGLKLVEGTIDESIQALNMLRDVASKSDAFWLIRDSTVITREFFPQVLLLQAGKKLPVVAYSEQFVQRGALCSYSADYGSQGKKAAQLAQSILNGKNPSDLPLQTPEGTLSINLTTARTINLTVPEALLKKPGVDKVGN